MAEVELDRLSLDSRKVINIVFAGHVDAGKSTICGRILVDLSKIDERTLEKFKQQSEEANRASWYLSWCMDLNPEERAAGRTVEVGKASFSLPRSRVNILDSPGHKAYIQEMINAAARADIGVLIVSARLGEFEAGFQGGQTKEHLLLLRLGGVDRLVVLVNKMDMADWKEERYREIVTKLEKYSKKIFQQITFIPICGQTGENVQRRFSCPFYNGPSFLEWLDEQEIQERSGKGVMTVVETVKTSGTAYIHCKVDSGTFSRDSQVKLLPSGTTDVITGVSTEAEVDVPSATAGDTFRLRLRDHGNEVVVGQKLVAPESEEFASCTVMYAQIGVLDAPVVVTVGFGAVLHIALQTVDCRILEIYDMDKKPRRVVREGERAIVKIKLESPVVVSSGAAKRDRFAIRHEAVTVASGIIKKVVE